MANIEPINRLKTCRHGQMLYNINDTVIGRSLDLYGEYCEGEIELFRQIVQPGTVVVEVGANIGPHTVFLSQQVTQQGIVVAFEPQRVVFQTLCANLALNSLCNVHCFHQAVGALNGTIVVPAIDYTHQGNFGGVSLGSHSSGEQVPLCRLDDLQLPACQFLKIDVEGMEQEVLQGAATLISQFRPVIYLESDKPGKTDALVRYLDSLSYKMYRHESHYFNPHNFFGNAESVFGNGFSVNMVCIHESVAQNLTGLEPVPVPPSGKTAD